MILRSLIRGATSAAQTGCISHSIAGVRPIVLLIATLAFTRVS